MLRAEVRHDIDGAVSFAESALGKVSDDESVFLIVEVTGRQLSYANRSAEANRVASKGTVNCGEGAFSLAEECTRYAR
jgi:hypothetical protein